MPPCSVPFAVPEIGEEEIQEVVSTLRSGWLTTGSRTARFEQEFRAYSGARHALAVSSGTAALHLPLVALGVGPGDEVITTPMTFCSTVHVILHAGATPVLADVGEDGNIDPASIAEQITPRSRALIPVHLGGLCCQMDAIWNLARKHGLFVLEDAAHAVGTQYRGRHLGSAESCSDAVGFSFYATKNLTTGEGGMVTTNNGDLADRMKRLTLHGISHDAWNRYADDGSWYYQVQEAGFKYNLSDIHAAIGIHQLRKLERLIEARATLARQYHEALGDVDELDLPPLGQNCRHAWHLYVVRIRPETLSIDRNTFIQELRRRGIASSVHFIPIPLHPFFARYAAQNPCPRAMDLYARIISLPLYPAMSDKQVHFVSSAVKQIVRSFRRSTVVALSAAN